MYRKRVQAGSMFCNLPCRNYTDMQSPRDPCLLHIMTGHLHPPIILQHDLHPILALVALACLDACSKTVCIITVPLGYDIQGVVHMLLSSLA